MRAEDDLHAATKSLALLSQCVDESRQAGPRIAGGEVAGPHQEEMSRVRRTYRARGIEHLLDHLIVRRKSYATFHPQLRQEEAQRTFNGLRGETGRDL